MTSPEYDYFADPDYADSPVTMAEALRELAEAQWLSMLRRTAAAE